MNQKSGKFIFWAWFASRQAHVVRVGSKSTGFDRSWPISFVRTPQGDHPFILRISKRSQAAVPMPGLDRAQGRHVAIRQTTGSRSV